MYRHIRQINTACLFIPSQNTFSWLASNLADESNAIKKPADRKPIQFAIWKVRTLIDVDSSE